eukprot:Mrub_07346.p1 GENE.Mrub_07346~~Mrub_07346.p1  ORF type:complete len:264 (+),score=43.12 Mrub_07346:39-830(+)
MLSGKSEYDRSVNTYSPDGRIYQVEYACEAVKLGSTSIGIQTKDAIILAGEIKTIVKTKLVDKDFKMETPKLYKLNDNTYCIFSGIIGDAKNLVDYARSVSVSHNFNYKEQPDIEFIAQNVADKMSEFGPASDDTDEQRKKKRSRPYGCSFVIGGIDEHGPSIYVTDPGGVYNRWRATAIGSGTESGLINLKDKYTEGMSIAQAEELALKTLNTVMEEKVNSKNVTLVTITKDANNKVVVNLYDEAKLEQKISGIQFESVYDF